MEGRIYGDSEPLKCLSEHVHADDETVEHVRQLIRGSSGVLAVGSGTVNDIVKRAGELEGKPYTIFAQRRA